MGAREKQRAGAVMGLHLPVLYLALCPVCSELSPCVLYVLRCVCAVFYSQGYRAQDTRVQGSGHNIHIGHMGHLVADFDVPPSSLILACLLVHLQGFLPGPLQA